MKLPYQCLVACSRSTGDSEDWALFGAAGPTLVVQSSTGVASIWPPVKEHQADDSEQSKAPQETGEEQVKPSPSVEQKPNFSSLKISHDKNYLVGITAEDKCIRVFQIEAGWTLQQLSERCMARRPCSITLTADDSTILCADKFGDVYSLPLIQTEDVQNTVTEIEETKQYVPSASLHTVHSGRNRKVLKEQLKHAEKGRPKPKEGPKFKHELLLGHVSMLTDIVSATVGSRSYILTADRDEHIRVSRGLPQAHIIEGFCHGHDEFVNRLCLTKSGRLVSGGGDTHLYVWDWSSYCLLEKLPIQAAVMNHFRSLVALKTLGPVREEDFKVAVSGIWSVPHMDPTQADEILVACEGVPALFSFAPGSSSSSQTLPLRGNALDVAFVNGTAIISIDHVHNPGSTTEISGDQSTCRLQSFSSHQNGQWREGSELEGVLEWFNERAGNAGHAADDSAQTGLEKAVRDMLYGVGNLRKRPEAEAEASPA